MSETNRSYYSSVGEHVRANLDSTDLGRASAALQNANDARRKILHLHRANSLEEETARAEIYELMETPDITKLNKLFRSPVNLLPKDMTYSRKAALSAQEYFKSRAINNDEYATPKSTPESIKFDSIDDFEAFQKELKSVKARNFLQSEKNIKDIELKLDTEFNLCLNAMRTFESKFEDVNEIPTIPNRLNEDVHVKVKVLSEIITYLDKFKDCRLSLTERNERIQENTKPLPAAKTVQDIEEIMCQVENLSFPSACDD